MPPDDQPVTTTGRSQMITINLPTSARDANGANPAEGEFVVSTEAGHAPFTQIVITGPRSKDDFEQIQDGPLIWRIDAFWSITIK